MFVPSSDIFLEKHWRSVVSRSVCDYFLDAQRISANVSPHTSCNSDDSQQLSNFVSFDLFISAINQDVPPVIQTPHYYLISIQRGNVSLVAACKQETQPLFVIEFLHRVVDTFQDYFAECSESIIKENYVVVYELLDEMLDNGFPLATESNILKELIKPPNILRTLANSVTGKSK